VGARGRSPSYTGYVQAAVRPAASGVWQAPVTLVKEGGDAQLAVDPQGEAVAVWEQAEPGSVIQAVAGDAATGVWQPPVDLSAGQPGNQPQVGLDARGRAVALWVNRFGVHYALRPAAGGNWQPPAVLGEGGEARLAVGARGNAVAIWSSQSVEAATFEPPPRKPPPPPKPPPPRRPPPREPLRPGKWFHGRFRR